MTGQPREILTFAPPGGEFHTANYPWLTEIRVCIRGGDGGAASNGNPGGKGETAFATLRAEEIPATLRIVLGRGGRGAPGAQDGQDGFALVELYDQAPPG